MAKVSVGNWRTNLAKSKWILLIAAQCENVQLEEGSYACYTKTTNPSAKTRVENGQNKTWFYCSEKKDLNRYLEQLLLLYYS